MGRLVEVCGGAGGGEGMGAIEKTIQALADQVGSACQVVAICGRNKGLIKRLEAKQYPAGMQVQHASIPAFSLQGPLLSSCFQNWKAKPAGVSHSCHAHSVLSHLQCMSYNVLGFPRKPLAGSVAMCHVEM